jgi:hypothetical protein
VERKNTQFQRLSSDSCTCRLLFSSSRSSLSQYNWALQRHLRIVPEIACSVVIFDMTIWASIPLALSWRQPLTGGGTMDSLEITLRSVLKIYSCAALYSVLSFPVAVCISHWQKSHTNCANWIFPTQGRTSSVIGFAEKAKSVSQIVEVSDIILLFTGWTTRVFKIYKRISACFCMKILRLSGASGKKLCR